MSNSRRFYRNNAIRGSWVEDVVTDLLLEGTSYRKTRDILRMKYGYETSHDTLFRFFHEYVKPIKIEIILELQKRFENRFWAKRENISNVSKRY